MAKELEIKITTKYDQAEKGFNKVTDSVQKYRKELLKASAEGKVTDETITKYTQALSKQLAIEDQTKEGMAALTSQAKILKREMTEIGLAFGEKGLFKDMKTALDEVNAEMAKTPSLAKKASGGMDDFGNKSGNAAIKLLSVAKNILKFQLLMGPITAAIRGFKNTLSDSVKVAAEAEQRFNKLATVFDGFEDSAKKMASSLASALGVATSTSASALSTVGDLLQAQGMGTVDSLLKSSEWVKQFQDIIAFKDINMSLEEFAQNFMSGAAGNLRNFRTFGSIVKESAVNARLAAEGLDKLTGSQLELAKMTTRATMALEQQKNAMGATKREWDTMLSVNRRLSESWKEYKENLGDTINRFLKPAKSWLSEILDYTNDVTRALKEIKGGEFTIKVQQDTTDRFINEVSDVLKSVSSGTNTTSLWGKLMESVALSSGATMQQIYPTDKMSAQSLSNVMLSTGANASQLKKALDIIGLTDVSDDLIKEAEKLTKTYIDQKKALDARKASISSAADAFTSFQESLLGIAGVKFNATDVSNLVNRGSGSDTAMNGALGIIGGLTFQSIDKALASLNTDNLAETFGDVISGALDDLDEKGLREAQVESLRKLFEASWNQFAEGGFTKEEKDKLEEIKTSYKEATSALEEYNKNIQRQNALLSANSTLASVLSNTSRLKYESGLTGPQSSKDLDMTLNWDIPLLIQEYAKAMRESGVALNTVMERSEIYRKALVDEARLKYQIAVKAERDAQIAGVPTDARTAVANFGLSDREIKRNELVAKAGELAAKHDSLWIEYQKEIEALDELTKLEAQKALLDKVNPFSGVQSAWQMGQDAGVGGLMGILADILSQTEAFSELTDIVSDTFVPIFNAILKPLMPALKAVTSLFDALPWDVFFEVFKIVAEVIVAISTVIKVISAVIKNIYTAVHNILQRLLHPITGGDQRPYESLEKIMKEANDNLEKIKNSSFKIERNTESDDLKALRELYYNKVINESQLYTGAKVLQKDIPFEALDNYAANVTYNITNNVTVNANDEEGMNKFKRTMEENGIPLGYTFRVHGYSY